MTENNITNEQNAEQQAPQAEVAVETATPKAPVAVVETAHDDFDWSVDKRNVSSYSKEEKEKYNQTYDSTFKVFDENSLLTGTVVGLTNTDVVINIGFKSDGLISLNEFRDLPGLKIGDEVVFAPFLLTRTRVTGGDGNGQFQIRMVGHQASTQRRFPRSRWGHDNQHQPALKTFGGHAESYSTF